MTVPAGDAASRRRALRVRGAAFAAPPARAAPSPSFPLNVGRGLPEPPHAHRVQENAVSDCMHSEDGGAGHELWFQSLRLHGPRLRFPCDALGVVRLDALSDRQRANYLFARAMVGRDYAAPEVVPLVPERTVP